MKLLKLDHPAALAIAPSIWALHFLVCYVLVSLACMLGWTRTILGINPAEIGIALFTLGALVLLALTAVISYERYRDFATDTAAEENIGSFIALNSVLLCGISAVALIWVAFPALMLPVCAI